MLMSSISAERKKAKEGEVIIDEWKEYVPLKRHIQIWNNLNLKTERVFRIYISTL